MMAHLDPTSVPEGGAELDEGGALANIGNSGNSDGAHTHLEAAINDSGLTQGEDQSVPVYWWNTIVERARVGDQGNRIDPTPLLDIP
jgi:murein DD-endopeptidase MepM/ murein hydrolase activator NlpD